MCCTFIEIVPSHPPLRWKVVAPCWRNQGFYVEVDDLIT